MMVFSLKPKLLKIAEHFRFYKRNQQQGEHVTDYVAELRRLAVNCEFGNFLDEALCDCLCVASVMKPLSTDF